MVNYYMLLGAGFMTQFAFQVFGQGRMIGRIFKRGNALYACSVKLTKYPVKATYNGHKQANSL